VLAALLTDDMAASVVQAVERGRADVAAGRTLPHEPVAADLHKKGLLGAAE
jgi:hypothetical protein